MPFITAIILIPLIAVLFYAFVMFDRLLRAEYQQHRPVWETDGRPAGFFWRAEECDFFTGHGACAHSMAMERVLEGMIPTAAATSMQHA